MSFRETRLASVVDLENISPMVRIVKYADMQQHLKRFYKSGDQSIPLQRICWVPEHNRMLALSLWYGNVFSAPVGYSRFRLFWASTEPDSGLIYTLAILVYAGWELEQDWPTCSRMNVVVNEFSFFSLATLIVCFFTNCSILHPTIV